MANIKFILTGRYEGFDNHGYDSTGTYEYTFDHLPTDEDIKKLHKREFGYMTLFLKSYSIDKVSTERIYTSQC